MKKNILLLVFFFSASSHAEQDAFLAPCTDNGEKIKILNIVTPRYPTSPVPRLVEGYVKLKIIVMPNGKSDSVEILESEPAGFFERSAIHAVERWQFVESKSDKSRCGKYVLRYEFDDNE